MVLAVYDITGTDICSDSNPIGDIESLCQAERWIIAKRHGNPAFGGGILVECQACNGSFFNTCTVVNNTLSENLLFI